MGGALLDGWRQRGLAGADAYVVEPDAGLREAVRERHGVVALAEPKLLPTELAPRALVFAVKPQTMAAVLPSYEALATSRGGRPFDRCRHRDRPFRGGLRPDHAGRARDAQHAGRDRPGGQRADRQRQLSAPPNASFARR